MHSTRSPTLAAALACLVAVVAALNACSGGDSSDGGGGGSAAEDGAAADGTAGGGSSGGGSGGSSSGNTSSGNASSGAGGSTSSSGGMPFTCTGCLFNGQCQDGGADNRCGHDNSTCVDCTGMSLTPVCGPARECVAAHAAGDAGSTEAGPEGASPVDGGGG